MGFNLDTKVTVKSHWCEIKQKRMQSENKVKAKALQPKGYAVIGEISTQVCQGVCSTERLMVVVSRHGPHFPQVF